jgi:MFS transporter, DHA2 family, multidrug resistance protein
LIAGVAFGTRSVGIAFSTTLLAQRTQFHQSVLSAHVSQFDLHTQSALATIKQTLLSHGVSAAEATQRALGMLYGMLQKQSAVLAYIDMFKVMAVIFLVIVPFAVVMKRIKHGPAPAGAH